MEKIKILLVGFGNIGRSVITAASRFPDLEIIGVVTRRPDKVREELNKLFTTGDSLLISVYDLKDSESYLNCGANVAIMCGGSKTDLPKQTPYFAQYFNLVDSFDIHDHIGPYIDEEGQPRIGHFQEVNIAAYHAGTTAIVGVGWDPGTFSLMRVLLSAGLGIDKAYAFYGLTEKGGLSMGHSNAVKGIPGVVDARQYTHANMETIQKLCDNPDFHPSTREMHWRECRVVIAPDADQEKIKQAIISMPAYFAPYDTTVKFVSQADLDQEKDNLSHDGLVIATGVAGYMEFKNVWISNPLGTAGFLLAYARAAYWANQDGSYGAFTTMDIPVGNLLPDFGKRLNFF
jgi:diaminopimelate dehydrogenase